MLSQRDGQTNYDAMSHRSFVSGKTIGTTKGGPSYKNANKNDTPGDIDDKDKDGSSSS